MDFSDQPMNEEQQRLRIVGTQAIHPPVEESKVQHQPEFQDTEPAVTLTEQPGDHLLAPAIVVTDESVTPADHSPDDDQPSALTFDQPYGTWSYMTRLEASATAVIAVLLGVMLLGFVLTGFQISGYMYHDDLPWIDLSSFAKNAYKLNLNQVLAILPWTVAGCLITSTSVAFVAGRSRSRQIDWTDSHIFLEYSGPVSLALKWSSIVSIDQSLQWELFHGKQPVFVVKTREGNVFRLRLSDITQKHNIGEFFSLIKTNAPHAEVNVNRDFSTDNSYTELWLKYFSAPAQREKTGLLQKDMLLDRGRYIIHGTVGGGGQGTAYLATFDHQIAPPVVCDDQQRGDEGEQLVEHIMLPNEAALARTDQVVLKEYVLPVHRGQLTAERTTDKLREEAQILQRLQHPQIVELLDAFIEDYRGYLVLEYVSGEPLKSLVERGGPQPIDQVIDWALQSCSILGYLHGLTPPVVHRDITPDNLMLQDDGKIKLVDFNVAYQVDSSTTATVVGKHAYIPAEQFRGKPTPQSDVYALGGTIFFLLTGEEPEPITQSHPRALNAKVSEELDAIVAKSTANSLTERFATVEELAEALRNVDAVKR